MCSIVAGYYFLSFTLSLFLSFSFSLPLSLFLLLVKKFIIICEFLTSHQRNPQKDVKTGDFDPAIFAEYSSVQLDVTTATTPTSSSFTTTDNNVRS